MEDPNLLIATSTGWVPVTMINAQEFKMVRDALVVLVDSVSKGQNFAAALANANCVLKLTEKTLKPLCD